MRVNFLTTDISVASGGAIYDKNFYSILKRVYPQTKLYNDNYFVKEFNGKNKLLNFNIYYKDSIEMLFDCDYLIMNSRLYTRMMMLNINKVKKFFPNTKLIVIHHHSNFLNHSGLIKWIHKYFESRILKKADELVIPNEYVVDQVKKDLGVSHIKFLPSSFDKKKYAISSLTNNILLFVGNIERRKGILYGLKAFKYINEKYPKYEYHIVGKYDDNDKYYKQLKKYVNKNNLTKKVIFEGRVSEERLDWLYTNSDIFLFPSLLEGYGWVIMEAMGRGVPVVAFNNSAMPYTIKDDINGLIIKNKDSIEMASRTCKLLNSKEKLKKIQSGALETYKNVSDQDYLNKITEEYFYSWS